MSARRKGRRQAPSNSVESITGIHDVTPLAVRQTTRHWVAKAPAVGVEVSAEEGVRYCRKKKTGKRCDWCESHADSPDEGHAIIDPDSCYLGIHFAGAEISQWVSTDVFLAVIDRLTAVRDRMVADGALPSSGLCVRQR